ncbi:ThiF family adenylyltransferase [Tardiphaga sp. 1201_B9_N1_1]|uniref:ThiF family adenylyltransferase n=1 Tax=unclassified Tardiphaga TaxID=2631404 RepID=UPI003F254CC8
MTLPLPASASTASAGLHAWFIGLGNDFIGRVPEPSLRSGMVEGWRVAWRGCEIEVQIDADFPFSSPRVYLSAYTRARAQPHIEKNGKLCLGGRASPGDAVRSISNALAETFQLLTENESQKHEDDFREDFGLYWLDWAPQGAAGAKIWPGDLNARQSRFAIAISTDRGVYIFPSKVDAGRFFTNVNGAPPRRPKGTAVIAIAPLPAPDRYPASAADLWALVEGRSEGGTEMLASLIANDPKEAFVAISGLAPSGREHYAAMRIHRPLDPQGRMLKARAMRAGLEQATEPSRALFSQYVVERLPTSRLDAASSRMPAGIQQEMATAKVVIVGCGALGSGVARLLAQAGVEHIDLIDPGVLGWENIRRHELGARAVGKGKAEALSHAIRADLPAIRSVRDHPTTFATFARNHPDLLAQADLVVSCTGEWVADASVEHILKRTGSKAAAVYGWMEAHALAAHAVLIRGDDKLADGFDGDGNFRTPAVAGGRPPPPECGGASTPFGAIELSTAQALVSRLAVDAIRGTVLGSSWRTWLSDATALREAEASWSVAWVNSRGHPDEAGGQFASDWTFA